jgi:hypothetical protein
MMNLAIDGSWNSIVEDVAANAFEAVVLGG